jgi:hypothetical protein
MRFRSASSPSLSSFAASGLVFGLSVMAFGLGCGDTPPAKGPDPVNTLPDAAPAPSVTVAPAPTLVGESPYKPRPFRFENPGGMWMPNQMGAHAAKLKELGLQVDPVALTDPTSNVLGAVVSLGGCSASFVSSEGLVITNHHCAVGALQYSSSAKDNLLHDGFVAKTRQDERSNGPTSRVFVTQKVTDVTKRVWDKDVPARMTDQQRFKLIEKRQKDLVQECEKGRTGVRCSVSTFYEGAAYYLIEYLELRDIRLVYAPAEGVGNYGGEIDNWRWPRHSGDVSIFRAYVSPSGQPADYAANNVPYRPKHFLRPASKPLEESDLVMVAGYPGRTYSLKTHAEAEEWVGFKYPRGIKLAEDVLGALEKLSDKEAKIRANPFERRFGNALTNYKGQLDGLVKDGLLAQKATQEKALIEFVETKQKSNPVLNDIRKSWEAQRKTREADTQLRSEFLMPRLVGAAYTIVRMAEERPKPDAERDPEYQERNWARHTQALEAMERQYHPLVDAALLRTAYERLGRAPAGERAAVPPLSKFVAPEPVTAKDKVIEKTRQIPPEERLFRESALAETKARVDLFKNASLADLKRSKDPLVRFALALRPLVKAADERDEAMSGRMAVLKPAYFDQLRGFVGKEIAPDANSTLRITYGTVRGYKPAPDKELYRPFTLLPEMIAKNTGKDPFEVPANLLQAYKDQRFGAYVDSRWGAVPVDFLSDLHITGGNSGSATLNAKGEICGLVFDGNYEALASDWLFKPELTRSIHVDIRYVYWLLDAVDGGDHILTEMGVTPSVR